MKSADKISEINHWLYKRSTSLKNTSLDENLFEAGIALGRILEAEKISEYKIDFFKEQNLKLSNEKRIDEICNEVEVQLLELVKFAAEKSIKEGNYLSYSWNSKRYPLQKFSENIVEKLQVQHIRTDETNEYDNFNLKFSAVGDLRKVFQKHGVDEHFFVKFENNGNDESDLVQNIECLDYYINVRCLLRRSDKSIAEIETFSKSLIRKCMFLKINMY